MTNKHYFAYYFQFLLLLMLGVGIKYMTVGVYTIIFSVFFISEFYLLEQGRKMDPVKIRYRKSPFFGILDMISVGVFFMYLSKLIIMVAQLDRIFSWSFLLTLKGLPMWGFSVLIWYVFVRKFYIYKNLTYEK